MQQLIAVHKRRNAPGLEQQRGDLPSARDSHAEEEAQQRLPVGTGGRTIPPQPGTQQVQDAQPAHVIPATQAQRFRRGGRQGEQNGAAQQRQRQLTAGKPLHGSVQGGGQHIQAEIGRQIPVFLRTDRQKSRAPVRRRDRGQRRQKRRQHHAGKPCLHPKPYQPRRTKPSAAAVAGDQPVQVDRAVSEGVQQAHGRIRGPGAGKDSQQPAVGQQMVQHDHAGGHDPQQLDPHMARGFFHGRI